MTSHASQREYFLKLISSTFLFELSKFIRLVRGNRTVRGNQCRKGYMGTKNSSQTQSEFKKMVYTAYA